MCVEKLLIAEKKALELAQKYLPSRGLKLAAQIGYDRMGGVLMLAGGVGTLITVWTMQLFLGVDPCILCYYQRLPYYFAGVMGIVCLFRKVKAKIRQVILGVCGGGFIINIGIAAFHIGVERKWWEGTESCGFSVPKSLSLDDLNNAITGGIKATLGACNEIGWSLFGQEIFTLPVLNLLGSSFMTAAAFWFVWRGFNKLD